MSHTPSPWIHKASANDGGLIHGPKTGNNISNSIASVHHREDQAEFSANAALISAAPDMLAALETLRGWCDKNINGVPREYGMAMAAADEAIAKALGK